MIVARTRKHVDPWSLARARYEIDPLENFTRLSKDLKVSRQYVAKRATAEGWVKALDSGGLAHAANVAADKTPPPPLATIGQPPPMPPAPTPLPAPGAPRPPETLVAPGGSMDLAAAATTAAIAQRADILSRHRNEWRVARGLWQEVIAGRSKPNAELSKLALRMTMGLKTIQEGERRAWGLDMPEAPPPGIQATVKVIVERETARIETNLSEDDDD